MNARQRLIEWTGERCVPWGDEVQGIYEHLHRYHFASLFVEGKRVLDLASGEGYGAAILARRAKEVVGLELEPAAVAHSRAAYDLPNLRFVEGSMLDLSAYRPASFDVVVCFEAIEHISEQPELIAGIERVVAEDGVVLLSTPDRETYDAGIHEPNPFHVRELSRSELLGLVRPHFPHVLLWGQNGIGGSRLVLLNDKGSHSDTLEKLVVRRGDDWLERPEVAPMFFVAVASRAPQSVDVGRFYLLDPTAEALRDRDRRVSARDARIRELKEENAALYEENERLRNESSTQAFLRRFKTKLRAVKPVR